MDSILIKDFQAHKKLKVVFDPNITTIVGPSDTGKSAVIRAIRWVMTNKPTGNSFVHHGAKSAKVLLNIGGSKITRERGSVNKYKMDGQEFAAFGNNVPPSIADFLNIEELNFQSQFDAPFWFSKSPGEVGRELNKIIDLGQIDTVLSNINTKVRKSKSQMEVCKQRVAEQSLLKKKLAKTKELYSDFQKLEELQNHSEETRKQRDLCETLLDRTTTLGLDISASKEKLEALRSLFKTGVAWQDLSRACSALTRRANSMITLRAKASVEIPDISELEDLHEKAEGRRQKRNALKTVLTTIMEIDNRICIKQSELEKTRGTFQKKIGNICPLCKSTIKS